MLLISTIPCLQFRRFCYMLQLAKATIVERGQETKVLFFRGLVKTDLLKLECQIILNTWSDSQSTGRQQEGSIVI